MDALNVTTVLQYPTLYYILNTKKRVRLKLVTFHNSLSTFAI